MNTETIETPEVQNEVLETSPETPDPASGTEVLPVDAGSDAEVSPEEGAEPEDSARTGFERKAKKLTQRAKDAEQAAQYWYNEAIKAQGKPTATPEPKASEEPKFSDFNDIDAYGKAIGKFMAENAVKVALAQREQETSSSGLLQQYNTRLAAFKKATPDFDEVFEDLDVPMPEDLMQGILESEQGPDLAYYLAKNEAEVLRLNKLSPYRRLVELGKLEVKLMKEEEKTVPVKKVSAAPAGIKTPNATTTAKKDEDSMSTQEWIDYRNKQDKTIRRNR